MTWSAGGSVSLGFPASFQLLSSDDGRTSSPGVVLGNRNLCVWIGWQPPPPEYSLPKLPASSFPVRKLGLFPWWPAADISDFDGPVRTSRRRTTSRDTLARRPPPARQSSQRRLDFLDFVQLRVTQIIVYYKNQNYGSHILKRINIHAFKLFQLKDYP